MHSSPPHLLFRQAEIIQFTVSVNPNYPAMDGFFSSIAINITVMRLIAICYTKVLCLQMNSTDATAKAERETQAYINIGQTQAMGHSDLNAITNLFLKYTL